MVNTTTLNPSADTYLRSSLPTSNMEGSGSLFVGEYKSAVGDISHTLLKFDLSGITNKIIAARLRIYDKGTDFATNTRTMSVYRMLRSWVVGQATWNVYSTGNNWGTAGAENTTSDRESSSIGSISMPGTEVAGYVDIHLTTSLIEEMRNGTLTNNGLLLRMATETDDLHDFADDTGANDPQLIVDYVDSGEDGVSEFPSKDVHLTNTIPTGNQDAESLDVGEYNGGSSDIRRALLKFTLSTIPVNATITGVTFRIYDQAPNLANNTRTMRAYRMKRDWGETTATWNTYDGSNNWEAAGAEGASLDREAADFGSISMPGTEVLGYVSFALTATEVQDWIDGSFTNNGFLMRMDTEVDDLHRFYSSEAANGQYPQIVVSYTLPSDVGGIIFI